MGKPDCDILVVPCNPTAKASSLSSLTNPHPKRTAFFAKLDTSDSVTVLIEKSLRPTFRIRVRMALRQYKQLINRVLKNLMGGGNNEPQRTPIADKLPSVSSNATVSSITFRNKLNGRKAYRIEIKISHRLASF